MRPYLHEEVIPSRDSSGLTHRGLTCFAIITYAINFLPHYYLSIHLPFNPSDRIVQTGITTRYRSFLLSTTHATLAILLAWATATSFTWLRRSNCSIHGLPPGKPALILLWTWYITDRAP